MSKKRLRWWHWTIAGLLAASLLVVSQFVCISAWLRYGIVASHCPDGAPRQTVFASANGLRRNTEGSVSCGARALFTTGPADEARQASVGRVKCELALVVGAEERPLSPKRGWHEAAGALEARGVVLPEIPDGDYLLRARVRTPLGEEALDVPLAVYAPARVHVITDRPLYEPGNTVRFRAVVLRARDLTPLDGRPGRWMVTDPTGEILLEEKAPAGEWGVVAGSFPLDSQAVTGHWRVRWASGEASDEVSFQVEPFTLPRFRVEAAASRPFYGRGDTPELQGAVVYSSGAPVARAEVALEWSPSGAWPVPSDWLEGALPRGARTDEWGHFRLALPQVPGDLRGRVSLAARLTATDPAGDRVDGHAAVLLAEEPIQVAAVTELGDRLVQGFSNRVYLRVTDAAGSVLPRASLLVKRAWDPADEGTRTECDEDGVAQLQLDPGPPINVVIPPMPVRPRKRPPAVSRGAMRDLIGDGPSLADLRAADSWTPGLLPCARFSGGRDSVTLGVRVERGGGIAAIGFQDSRLARCLAKEIERRRLPPGDERLFRLSYSIGESDLPELRLSSEGIPGTSVGLDRTLATFALDARECVAKSLSESSSLPRLLSWRVRKESKEVTVSWSADPHVNFAVLDASQAACIERKLSTLRLEEPAQYDAVGFARLVAEPSLPAGESRPPPTVAVGYELLVEASVGGEERGAARLLLLPGSVPEIRLRVSPVVAEPGGKLTVEIVRGPSFTGKLPEKLCLKTEERSVEAKVDPKKREAVFELPKDLHGWLEVQWGGARVVAWVRPPQSLDLALRAEEEQYAPGQTAKLLLETAVGGKGARAAVGLFGVDESLAQLVPLAGPDDMARVRPKVEVSSPAFAALDAQALTMGRVRGAHAVEATILKVSTLPTRAEIDSYVYAHASSLFDPVEELTDRFYVVLAELHAQVRAWELEGPKGEVMGPALMAKMWDRALAACEKRDQPVRDAYGRKLRLSSLPSDLLALVEPRAVVLDGLRLPEDTENWAAWVAEEEP